MTLIVTYKRNAAQIWIYWVYWLTAICTCGHQSLEALVRGKELELEQAAEAYRNLQWLKQQTEEKERNTQREKDMIISQLQSALQTRSQETQVTLSHFTCAFIVIRCNCYCTASVKSSLCIQTCATCSQI